MKFHKIENPIYTLIENYAILDGNQIQAKYVVGTGEEKDGKLTNFAPLATEFKYINGEQAQALQNAPLTADDIGKTPTEIMIDRIYNHLKTTGEILA